MLLETQSLLLAIGCGMLTYVLLCLVSMDSLYFQACTLARRTAETFLKYIDKNVNQLGMPSMKSRYPKNNVQGKLLVLFTYVSHPTTRTCTCMCTCVF